MADQNQKPTEEHTWDSIGIAGPGSMAAKFRNNYQLSNQNEH
jgi:hypothetical protein